MSTGPDRRLYERIYLVVQQVPSGAVATYGDVAAVVGDGCDARTVGYALNELKKGREDEVPWQRIVNAQGGISTPGSLQREVLESEGIPFDLSGRIDLARYRWSGPDPAWAAAHGFAVPAPRAVEPEDPAGQLRLF